MVPGGSPLSGWLTLAWMCVIGLLIGAGVFRVRAGSHWEERWVPAAWLPELGRAGARLLGWLASCPARCRGRR